MTDYSNLGLNEFLQPIAAPVSTAGGVSAYEFDSLNDRDVIRTAFINGSAVIDSKLGTFSANKITAGTINASTISVTNLNASNITSGTMSFNRASGGTLVLGGTSNGNGLLQINNAAGTTIVQGDNLGHHYYGTSGTQELIKIDSSGFHSYNSGGTTLYEVKNDGFYGYGTSAAVFRLRSNDATTSSYGFLGYTTISAKDYFYIPSGDGKGLAVLGDADLLLFSGGANNDIGMTSTQNVNVFADSDTNITADNDIFIISDYDSDGGAMYFRNNASNVYRFWNSTGYQTLTMNANKTAIMPTSDGYRALYCIESPEMWFMDFVEKKGELDPLFAEVTAGPYKYIKCDDDTYQVWGRRKGKGGVRFEKMTQEQFEQNDNFWAQAYRPARPDYSVLIKKVEGIKDNWNAAKKVVTERKLEKVAVMRRNVPNPNYDPLMGESGRFILEERMEPVYVLVDREVDEGHPDKQVAIEKLDAVVEKLRNGVYIDIDDESLVPRPKRYDEARPLRKDLLTNGG